MGAQTKITITHDVAEGAVDLQSKGLTAQNGGAQHVAWLSNLLAAVAGKSKNGIVATVIDNGDGVAATGTITFSDVATANDTILINGQTLTAVASGATNNQYNVGASATAQATNLAAAINASTTALIKNHVTASSAAGVVTIKSVAALYLGNAVTTAKGTDAGSVVTVSGARLTGGANPTGSSSVSYSFGV